MWQAKFWDSPQDSCPLVCTPCKIFSLKCVNLVYKVSTFKRRSRGTVKCPYSQSCGFSSSHVWMWELDHKESWAPKNSCFWTVVLEKTFERPLDCKKSKPVNPKGNQSWVFIGMTDSEAETPILWLPDVKNWLFGKDLDAEKDWGQEEKRMTEDARKKTKWVNSLWAI